MPKSEAAVKTECRLAVGMMADVVLWPNPCGFAHQEKVTYGLAVGSSDLIGIGPGGRFLAIELKAEDWKWTNTEHNREQEMFLALVRKMGGFGCRVRSARELEDAIERMRQGKSE